MGTWGSGPLENDGAWDFVNYLVEGSLDERSGKLLAALEVAAGGGWLDIDEASGAVVAALLVAAARDPAGLTAERKDLVDHTAAVHDVSTFGDLVGDLRAIRTAPVADLALRAIERVVEDSEIRDLSEGDLDEFVSSFDHIRTALRSPLRRWTAAAGKPSKVEPLRRRWVAGTLISIDLGDGYRSYAQFLEPTFVACYDVRQPVTDPALSAATIVSRPVLFTIAVNSYMDRPAGWVTIGPLPEGRTVPPTPTTFKQEHGRAQECYLGPWSLKYP